MDTNFLGGAIHKYEQKDNDDDGADKVAHNVYLAA